MSRSCQSATFSIAGITAMRTRRARPGQVLRQDRVALVGHGRRALLPLGEELLGLQHLGPLHVADLDGDVLDGGRDHAQRGEEHRVPVARDDLRRDRLGAQAQFLADMFLDRRVDIGEGPDRARDRARGHLPPRPFPDGSGCGPSPRRTARRSGPWSPAPHGCRGTGRCAPSSGVPSRGSSAPSSTRSTPASRRSAARTSWMLNVVSSTSEDVIPWCTNRASSAPTISARWVRKAITSCLVTASISSMRATSNSTSWLSTPPPRSPSG
jgi:hypothetical protein